MVFIKCNQNHKEAMAVVESTPRNKVNMRIFFFWGMSGLFTFTFWTWIIFDIINIYFSDTTRKGTPRYSARSTFFHWCNPV